MILTQLNRSAIVLSRCLSKVMLPSTAALLLPGRKDSFIPLCPLAASLHRHHLNKSAGVVHTRGIFSGKSPKESFEMIKSQATNINIEEKTNQAKRLLRNLGFIAIGASSFYLFVTWGYDLIYMLLNLSFVDSGKFGFYAGGLLTSVGVIGLYSLAKKYSSVTPEELVKIIVKQCQTNSAITETLGTNIKPSKFTAYAYTGGLNIGRNEFSVLPVSYSPKCLEVIFQVEGQKSNATATAKASRTKGLIKFHTLTLDLSSGERVVLSGVANHASFLCYLSFNFFEHFFRAFRA